MLQPARYTEVLVNLISNPTSKQAIDKAMSTYPLYESKSTDNTYGTAYVIPTREQLNNKILNYYRWREIGFETVGRFLFELETALNEIMPYYNQLFYSADQDFNPIYNVDYKRTIDRDKNDETNGQQSSESSNESSNESTVADTSSTTATTNGNAKNVHSATPQGVLNISSNNIDSINYADDATWNKDSSTQNGSSNGTSNASSTASGESTSSGTSRVTGNESESTVETTKGNFGVVSAQDLIIKYRDTILNIEQQIINDPRITELFMLVY